MKSTPYYVPVHPNYICNWSESSLKRNSSEIATATDRSFLQNKDADLLSSFLSDKLAIIEASIRQVMSHIAEREQLRDQMLAEIDLQSAAAKSLLMRISPYEGAPFTIGDPRRRSSIEKELSDLEGEKRRETTSAWKDIAALQKELRELQREYLEEKRKQRVMSI